MAYYWTKQTANPDPDTFQYPAARYGHTSTLVSGDNGRRLFVFAGWHRRDSASFNDLWTLELDSLMWKKIDTSSSPDPRGGHTATLVGDSIYVFGGQNKTSIFNDLYALDTNTLQWREIKTRGQIPEPRSQHICVYFNKNEFISSDTFLNARSRNNASDRSVKKEQRPNPFRRNSHFFDSRLPEESLYPQGPMVTNCSKKGYLLVMLGHDGYGKMYNSVYLLDLDTLVWEKVVQQTLSPISYNDYGEEITTTPRNLVPKPTGAAAASRVGNSVYVFGGRHHTTSYTNNLFSFNLETLQWEGLIEYGGYSPIPRAAHTLTPLGGSDETYETPKNLLLFGGSTGNERLDDILILNTETHEWSCPTISGACPGSHAVHTATQVGPLMLVYGGYNGEDCFSDLYILDTDIPVR